MSRLKPMVLKKRTPCCRQPTLAWSVQHTLFVCKCGKMRADELGRRVTDENGASLGSGKRGRPKKNGKMIGQDNGGLPVTHYDRETYASAEA